MLRALSLVLIFTCFSALFLCCYAPVLFRDRNFSYRDAGHYYYPLHERVQHEWNQGRWPLWEPEENAGLPLLGNPTAAVLYPGKLVFAMLSYAWASRTYIVAHSAIAFVSMLILMRSWDTTWFGSAIAALSYAFGAPVLFQYCNVIYLVGAAWLSLGFHAVDRWVRLGRRWAILELAFVLAMQLLGGDPQAAYLLGLVGIGYAMGLAWTRRQSASAANGGTNRGRAPVGVYMSLAALVLLGWPVVTLALAHWLPKLREPGKPTPPFYWMPWVPWIVAAVWGTIGLLLLFYGIAAWRKRGQRVPLCLMWLGLIASAALATALSAAQLLPVIEFTQRTTRAAETGTHQSYLFGVEPYRLIEMVWPNFLGDEFAGNTHWGEMIKLPGSSPRVWAPSLYAGGLTLVLALAAMAVRHGPPWRLWLSVIVVASALGSLGPYTSPLWAARAAAANANLAWLRNWLPDLGSIDAPDDTPIRRDGYLRDGDGGFYWFYSIVVPGFRQFRYPAKLFTFTTLGMAALAGLGWDKVAAGHTRGTAAIFIAFLIFSLAALAGVAYEREAILASLRTLQSRSGVRAA